MTGLALADAVAGPLQAGLGETLAEFLSPETLVGIVLDGLAKSALYAMIAAGLTLIFGLMGVLNFAHGSFTMLGAYLGGLVMVLVVGSATGTAARLGAFFLAALVVMAALGTFGGVVEAKLVRPLYERPPIYQILLTFGLTLVLDELARIVVGFYGVQPGSDWQAALGTKPQVLATTHQVGPVGVPGLELFETLAGVVTVAGVWLFLTRTRYGLYIRAGSEDDEMAEALGVDVRRTFTVVFALGSGLAGVAGVLLAWDITWGASVPLASETLLPAFVVVIVGGLGTFRGTVVAAVVVGMADAVTQWWFVNYIDFASLPQLVVFLILVGVLVVRPQGLFGDAEVGGH